MRLTRFTVTGAMIVALAAPTGQAAVAAGGYGPSGASTGTRDARLGIASPIPQGTPPPDSILTVRIGLKPAPLPFPIEFRTDLPDPAELRPEFRPRTHNWARDWRLALEERLERQKADLWRESRPVLKPAELPAPLARTEPTEPEPVAVDTTLAVADTTVAGDEGSEEVLPDVLDDYADLGFSIQGRLEMGGGWNKFRPCDVTIQLNCDPGLLPNLKPDVQFGARVGGTISDRVHVSVDYDNRREFDAANNINVYYQGMEDEILQRVEVGDVSFRLPQSRYLTRGIPAGNFGFRATGQMGPIDFQTVWAQQKGDVGTQELRLGGGGQGFEQDAVTVLDDADYERGRFFFLFDPRHLEGYPHVDIQRLIAADAPSGVRPASTLKVYRYEDFTFGIGNQIPEGFINAVAVASDTLQTASGADTVVADTLSGLFRPLVAGEDYVVHRSGLWLQLRNTLSDQEGLAITYRAADGTEIGNFNAEELSDAHNADPDNVPPPELALLKGVNHRPGTATWDREMHHVYRVSASPGVVSSDIEVTISQGDPELGNTFREAPDGSQLEFLKIFGLDNDPTDNRVDASQIYDAGRATLDGSSGPAGTYVVFPTLEPFAEPPPLEDVGGGLSGAPFPLNAGDRNGAIYDEPNDQIRRGANLYLLTISYRQRFEGFVSTISLGVGGVREGSERVTIDNVQLVRGEDYTIDYDIGQIELRDPERWFRNNPDAQVRVQFEQKPLFQLAPTTVFGLQATYRLGTLGEINFIGLSQTEKTLQTRPELGLEPSALRLGGISGRLDFDSDWLTDLVAGLPGASTETPSAISLDGELAMSLPTTNTEGVTYVEDFEGGPGFRVSLNARSWDLGSATNTIAGAEGVLPAALGPGNASEVVWQGQYVVESGDVVGGLLPQQIDEQLQIQGQERPEPVLFTTVRQPQDREIAPTPAPPSGPSWRSITTVISPNGQDMTSIEFLEFYVAVTEEQADSIDLIVDLGTVSEDAFAIDSLGVRSGAARLDREVEPPRIWSSADDIGLWDTGCQAERGLRAYPLGDVRANCTRNNGVEDSEDLNQNNILDTEERFFRYTIELGDQSSPYFERFARQFGGARFRLYRIPLRRPDHRERASDAEFQNIRHLRFTVVSQTNHSMVIARARFVGSRWLKRGRAGVVSGLADTTSSASPSSLVEVGPISTVDARYVPPPGITDQTATQTDQFQLTPTEFNEQSLRVSFTGLGADERGEVFLQYPQTPRDFLAYRSLRLWALGASGDWGLTNRPLRFFVKLGENARNFYLYRARLPEVPEGAEGAALRAAWRPELRIDFERFIALRARAEEVMLQEELPPDSVLQVWDVDVFEDADSTYAVVIAQRSRAPNLAAIRQISLGIHNAGSTPLPSGEVWVDDMRLGATVDNTGMVGQLNLGVRASDLLSLNASWSSENPYFRQLGQDPSFQSSGQFQVSGQLQAGRFLPTDWGVEMPLNVRYSSSSSNPVLLARTDIRGDRIDGLRTPMSRNLSADLRLSKRTPTDAPWIGWFLDNSALRMSYDQRTFRTSRSLTESGGIGAGYSYRSDVGDVSIPLLPGPLSTLFFFLPDDIKDTRLRLTPQSVQLNANYVNSQSDTRRFNEIIQLPGDRDVAMIERFDERLQTSTTVNLEPLNALTGQFSYSSDRELVPSRELVSGNAARQAINAERVSLFGLDLGWETARTMNSNLTYRPDIAPWLLPQLSVDARFRSNRSSSFLSTQEGDTALTQDFNNARNLRTSVSFNAPVLLRNVFGPETSGVLGALLDLIGRLDIVSGTWTRSLTSSFSREEASPTFGYQLGLGGFDAFRVQDRDTASQVIENDATTLSSGVRLPFNMTVSADFTRSDARVWTPLVRSNSESTDWPNVRFNWNQVPLPTFLSRWVRTFSLRTGYTLTTSDIIVQGADQDRHTEVRTIPFAANLALTTGWSLNYNLSMSESERQDPTGLSLGDSRNHSLQLNARFAPPSSSGTFQNPVRASLRFSHSSREECRQLGRELSPDPEQEADGGCEPFTDLTIRRLDLTVDTDVPPFVLGLQAGWTDRQSELGEQPGSTQLEISLFGQFLFETGVIR